MTTDALVVALAAAEAPLERVGGKARALGVLASAGLPVPTGFVITTAAYRQSSAGRVIPADVAEAIRTAYQSLGIEAAVAVRSSATVEDSPDSSFAGQQDSFLNVRGEQALLDAVRACWVSLDSERAQAYRARMGVDAARVAMAVVVQRMVAADVSGVLFTANPVSGDRSELVANASFGLGETVVGGQVTADTWIVQRDGLRVTQTRLGDKRHMTVAHADRGIVVERVAESRRHQPALSPDLLVELARLGLQAEALFAGVPQDVEWAVAGGRCWLLQSRPITALIEPLAHVVWEPPTPGSRLVRRQVVENMPAPLSPLFEELYLEQGLHHGMTRLVEQMGLPVGIDDFMDPPMFVTVNGFGYSRYDLKVSWRQLLLVPRMIWWFARELPKWLKDLVVLWRDGGLAEYQSTIEQWRTVDVETAPAEELLRGIRALATADAVYWFFITMMVGSAKMTELLLERVLAARAVRDRVSAVMFLRGFESRTLDARKHLTAIAQCVRETPGLLEIVTATPAERLLDVLATEPTAQRVFTELCEHLARYGHLVYNLDFVEPTLAEQPLPVLQSLRVLAADQRALQRDAARAEPQSGQDALVRDTAAALGPVRGRLFLKALAKARELGPYREVALFYMGAAWPVLRRLALQLGGRLTTAGMLHAADGVFYLRTGELEAACAALAGSAARPDLAEAAESRRAEREARKRLHPPGRVPEDLRFKLGPFDFTGLFATFETQKRNPAGAATLSGFAVSPGRVTGVASVIHSPAEFAAMQPGTILVCATTTPAWTPLFSQAIGLVTDIGAVLAHGSIVAREYGIPAVLGTGNATRRVMHGDVLTIDGSAGTVVVHD